MKVYFRNVINSFGAYKIKSSFLLSFYVFGILVLAILLVIHLALGIPFSHMTIDPVVELEGDAFTGLLSNFGVIIWSATAAICLFAASVFGSDPSKRNERNFFLISFIITALLLSDDLFLLHDIVLPGFGFRERHIYLLYGTLVIGYLFFFRKAFLNTPYIYLIIAFGFFGLSLFTDWIIRHVYIPEHYIIEDGTKFLGIITWSVYFTYLAYSGLKADKSFKLDV